MADVSLLRTAASADERLTLILQLGGTNDAHGKVDAEVRARSKRTAELVAARTTGSAGSGDIVRGRRYREGTAIS